MDEVLVTGANGFVGSHICEALIKAGFSVRALVRKTSDLTNIKGLPLKFIYGDLNDASSLPAAVAGVRFIINNAGMVKALHAEDFQRVNCGGTENILSAIKQYNPGISKMIHISSTAASGPSPGNFPINEEHPPGPLTAYGRSKLAGEMAVLAQKESVRSIVLRPCAVYGPRDKEMYSFFKTIKLGIKPHFGSGENYINFTYVKDLAGAVVKSIASQAPSGSIYFVAEKKSYAYSEASDILAQILNRRTFNLRVPGSVLSLAGKASEGVAKILGKPAMFTQDKVREILSKYWLFDTSKIEREMGFVGTDFKIGAEETIAWYKEHGWL
jgi:nucleoside-diphosphate-sugar epimerase